jgi:hypothetical protein
MYDWLEKELAETPKAEDKIEILKEELSNEIERADGWKGIVLRYEKALKQILKVETDSWEEDLKEIHKLAKESLGKRL